MRRLWRRIWRRPRRRSHCSRSTCTITSWRTNTWSAKQYVRTRAYFLFFFSFSSSSRCVHRLSHESLMCTVYRTVQHSMLCVCVSGSWRSRTCTCSSYGICWSSTRGSSSPTCSPHIPRLWRTASSSASCRASRSTSRSARKHRFEPVTSLSAVSV